MVDRESDKKLPTEPKQVWEAPDIRSLEVPHIDAGTIDGSPEVHLVVGAISLTGTIS